MATARFVLRYGGKGKMRAADVARVRGLPGAVILESTARMLLVEAEPEPLHRLVDTLTGWVMASEQTYAAPDPRLMIEGPPD